jgi:hypothetical protein
MRRTKRPAKSGRGYQVFMFALCVYALAILAYQAAGPADPATIEILEYSDFVVCLMFMGELALVLVTFASVAILNLENVEGANITSADAAIWWAFTTIMLVGYGDTFPVSGEGRVVVVLLMMAGLGLAATFAGLFASWFVDAEGEDEHSRALAVLREDVAALREELASKGRRP